MSHEGFGRMEVVVATAGTLAWRARMARRHLRVAAIGLVVVGVLAAPTTASAETLTFGPNSPTQPFHRWTVPAGVCGATFDLFGAEGSSGVGGARVTSTLAVVPGSSYDIYVGGPGTRGNGGYNGGGDASGQGNREGVGGGGATDVRTGPGLADRVLVAGGGGGNGGGFDGPIGGGLEAKADWWAKAARSSRGSHFPASVVVAGARPQAARWDRAPARLFRRTTAKPGGSASVAMAGLPPGPKTWVWAAAGAAVCTAAAAGAPVRLAAEAAGGRASRPAAR
jgi:hypothetical protein